MGLDNEFVSFEIAKQLKELGFREECFAYWKMINNQPVLLLQSMHIANEKIAGYSSNHIDDAVDRPMWFQVYRWLKTTYNFDVSVNKKWREESWEWKLYLKDSSEALCDNYSEEEIESKEKAQELLMQRVFWKIENPNSVEETRHERMLRLLQEHLDSPASDKYFEDLRIKEELQESRFKKLDTYLETHSFDELLQRLIGEHTEEYRDKCYQRGYEPYPNNKMSFVISYVESRGTQTDEIECDFSNSAYVYKEYFFETICGQGCFNRIYNKDKEIIWQS